MDHHFRNSVAKGSAPFAGVPEPIIQPSAAVPAAVKDDRWNDRHRLSDEQATLVYRDMKMPIDVINLSNGGAMVRGDFSPNVWERVGLILGEGEALECAVRWIKRDHFGLEFAHETQIHCDQHSRRALLLEVIQRNFSKSARVKDPAIEEPEPVEKATEETAIKNLRDPSPRHPLIWMGQVLYNHSTSRVRLRNVSSSGAMVDCDNYLPVGEEVLLDLGKAGQHFAVVAWSRGTQTGLRFKAPFDIKLLAAAKPTITPTAWVRPAFLERGPDSSNPWAPGWGRASLEEIKDDLEGYLKY